MAIHDPDRAEVRAAAAELGLTDLDDATCDSYLGLIAPNVESYRTVERSSRPAAPPTSERRWWTPEPGENPLGAWYVRTELNTREDGPLAGKSIAIKDNVSLAGVPMMNGVTRLRGFVPDEDASIVTRLLDAGATVTGKAQCECLCFSGGSHTNADGPVRNPHKTTHSSGGSSSGSAALVADGSVDLAIGGDQGGSIRIPSSWCGTVGVKPTYGLVPYTGLAPLDATIDHTGPITNNVAENALLLEVLAGADGHDPRQYDVVTHPYREALTGDCSGMRIGVVDEGFETSLAEPDVDEAVREAGKSLESLGAVVERVSIPWHSRGRAVWEPIALEGGLSQILFGNGAGTNWRGHYSTSLMEAMHGWRDYADEFSESFKVCVVVANIFRRRYGGASYARSQNLRGRLTSAYDAALASYDVLLMPTLPMKATELPPPDASRDLLVQRSFEMLDNTTPFDVTGHPAMNLPCAVRDGLPIGMMLVGRHGDESSLYRLGHAFESGFDWRRRLA